MSPAPVHFYIYYRMTDSCAAEARAALSSIMDALREDFMVGGRLLCAKNDAAVWMEVYENVDEPAAFEAALNGLLARTPFESWLVPGSVRRTERFVALGS